MDNECDRRKDTLQMPVENSRIRLNPSQLPDKHLNIKIYVIIIIIKRSI